ncbi:MAG: hypothetical protein STSR0009_16880 [Methanoregula sp.]
MKQYFAGKAGVRYCALAVLIVLAIIMPVSGAYSVVNTSIGKGATVFIGEQGLDLTPAISAITISWGQEPLSIGWWASAANIGTTAPTVTIPLTNPSNFLVSPATFGGYYGNWYAINAYGTVNATAPFMIVKDPQLSLDIWDFSQNPAQGGTSVSGKSVVQGDFLGFKIGTNMDAAINQPSRTSAGFPNTRWADIKVKTPEGNTLTSLLSASGTAIPLNGQSVNTPSWIWGGYAAGGSAGNWSTAALDSYGLAAYPPGTYSVLVESRMNGMYDNYLNAGAAYTGKTVSETRTVTIVPNSVEITANKDSVYRTKPFSVTITGRASTQYHLWVKGTSTMTGGVDDQPPMFAKFQAGVSQDVFTGTLGAIGCEPNLISYVSGTGGNAGGYCFLNSGSSSIMGTVWADVAHGNTPETRVILGNGTALYANVTTSNAGTRTIEFVTTSWTKPQKYTIHVEQNFSFGSNLIYKTDEVDVLVEKDAITIATSGNQIYPIGDEIQISGTSTGRQVVYLFVTGPGLPAEGAQMQSANPKSTPIVNGVPTSFAQASVLGDNTWNLKWKTGGKTLDPGIYTIFAASDPVDAQHLVNTSGYASVSILLTNQSLAQFIPLYSGWNFVSTPKKLANGNNTAAIFTTVDTAGHSIYLYNASEQSWHVMAITDKVQPLDGIWIYSNNTAYANLVFDSSPMQTPPTKSLSAGWNAIGFSSTTATSASTALNSVQTKWSTVIGFDARQQRYDSSIIRGSTDPSHGDQQNMYPERGYWLYMTEAGTLGAISA